VTVDGRRAQAAGQGMNSPDAADGDATVAKKRFHNLVGQAFQPDRWVRLESLTYVL
jgi:hypothetical protein